MKHDWNGLHLNWCWGPEARGCNVLHDSGADFVFFSELVKRSNRLGKICSLNVDLVLVSEMIYLGGGGEKNKNQKKH